MLAIRCMYKVKFSGMFCSCRGPSVSVWSRYNGCHYWGYFPREHSRTPVVCTHYEVTGASVEGLTDQGTIGSQAVAMMCEENES